MHVCHLKWLPNKTVVEIVSESLPTLYVGMVAMPAILKPKQYSLSRYAKCLFKHLVFIIEWLYDQQDS